MLRTLDRSKLGRVSAVMFVMILVAACSRTPKSESANVKPGTKQDLVINVGDRVHFEEDSAVLSPEAVRILEKQAAWLKKYGRYRVLIEGHADERGTREYNLALGARRAVAVREYLISRGVKAERLKTISYGKERPVAVCNAESCWNQNRRAVTDLSSAGS